MEITPLLEMKMSGTRMRNNTSLSSTRLELNPESMDPITQRTYLMLRRLRRTLGEDQERDTRFLSINPPP